MASRYKEMVTSRHSFSRFIDLNCRFFFNDTATTEIYTLSLHDALPDLGQRADHPGAAGNDALLGAGPRGRRDRKSTRLNSSHSSISYAVFCLKKKIPHNKLVRRVRPATDAPLQKQRLAENLVITDHRLK